MCHAIVGCVLTCLVLARPAGCADVDAELKAARERIKQLEALNEEYRKIIKRSEGTILDLEGKVRFFQAVSTAQRSRDILRTKGSVPPPEPNPPRNLVKGKVDSIDAKDPDNVMLSVGRDHGIEKDHTLYVYRMEPEPTYLGMIRILSVKHASGEGRLERTSVSRRIPLKAGDWVISDLKFR